MGIIITETKSLNNGVVLSEHYIGLRKDIYGKVGIHVDYDPSVEISGPSNVYKITSYFEHHISKDAKTHGKTSINSQLITIDVNNLETSETSIVSQLYTELKKQYTDFTEDI